MIGEVLELYNRHAPKSLNPIRPGGRGGGRGGGSARTDFNLWELPCYLSNTYETLSLLLKYFGEQNSGNF